MVSFKNSERNLNLKNQKKKFTDVFKIRKFQYLPYYFQNFQTIDKSYKRGFSILFVFRFKKEIKIPSRTKKKRIYTSNYVPKWQTCWNSFKDRV